MDKLESSTDARLRVPDLEVLSKLPPVVGEANPVHGNEPSNEFLDGPDPRPERPSATAATKQLNITRISLLLFLQKIVSRLVTNNRFLRTPFPNKPLPFLRSLLQIRERR